MRRTRITIAVFLLFALLLNGCGQSAAPAEEPVQEAAEAAVETEAEEEWPEMELPPFREFPSEAYPAQQPAPGEGQVTPVSMTEGGMFRAKFEGTDVAGSGEAADGVYHFVATQTDGEAWHVKLECNYPTIAGRDYFVTYRFQSDVAGTVKFGDFQEFHIQKGENEVTGILIASSSMSYLDLQLGMLDPFTIDFTEVEVKEYADDVEYENALSAPVNFEREPIVYERHDQGYGTILVRSADAVNVNYVAAPWDPGVWRSRLYVRTGLYPEAGTRYRVTADVMCDQDMSFELLFNNGEEEKGYGALYGQSLTAEQVLTCEGVVVGSGDGDELVLQFSFGEAPEGSQVIVGNVRVEKILDHYTSLLPEDYALDSRIATGEILDEMVPVSFRNIPLWSFSYTSLDTVYEQHDEGYTVYYWENPTNATLNIAEAPVDPEERVVWGAKLCADTGVTLDAGTTYRVRFDLFSDRDQADYEICFDGDEENDYGALYGRSLKAQSADQVEYMITPDESHGPLKIRIQLGKTDTWCGNTFTLENLVLESVETELTDVLPEDFSYDTGSPETEPELEYVSVLPDDFSYNSGVNVYEQHGDGYTQSVSSTDSSATLDITEAPSDGREVWNSKLLINTGVTPEAGERYIVTFDVTADKDQPSYEICFDGSQENSYGALYDQTLMGGEKQTVTYRFTPEESDGPLVIRLQLGKTDDASGNKITVSGIKIAAISADSSSILPDTFEYPTVTESEPREAGYYEVSLPDLSASEAHDEGYEQSLDGMSLKIDAVPPLGIGVWSSKLFVNTGKALEKGETYRITADVTSDKALDLEICYNNGGEEKGYEALYGQHIDAGQTKSFVKEFTVAEDITPAELVLQFMVGLTPAGNTFKVNSITVEKYIPEIPAGTVIPAHDEALDISLSAEGQCDDDYVQSVSGMSLTNITVPDGAGVWKSKLFVKTGKTLEVGKTYKITAGVESGEAFDFEICYNNDWKEKGYEALYGQRTDAGETKYYTKEFTVAGDITPAELILQFQFGLSPAGNTVTVTSVEVLERVEESTVEETIPASYEQVSLSDLNAWEQHAEGFEQSVSGTALNVTAVPTNGVWKSKLFIDTGKTLEAGAKYRVTANATASKETNFEICYNNGGDEKGYGALYGQNLTDEETKDLVGEFEVAADASTENLVLQFQLGSSPAPSVFTVNSVKLEKWEEAEETPHQTVEPNSFELWAHEDYKAALSGDGSSASVRFDKAPDDSREAWKTKLFADTGVTLKAGKSYRISADVQAEQELPYEICYNDVGTEKGVGAKYGLTAAEEAQTVTFDVTQENDAYLIIQFSLGHAAAGNTVTVSNIQVEELTETIGDNLMTDPLIAWAPVHQWTDEGYSADLTNTDSSASMTFNAVSSDQADWKAKLFIETGAELEAGKQYRIRYNVEADSAFDYNVFYNNGAEEKAVGEFYGLKAGDSNTVEHVVSPANNAVLNIQLMLGMSAAPNTVTVSGVEVEEIVGGSGSGSGNLPINFWAHEDYEASLSNTDSSASIAITKVPEADREAWKVKLFAETGAALEAGKTYRISVDVEADEDLDYEICYNNVEVEKELGAKYDLTASAEKQTVTYDVKPEKDAVLIIQFGLGKASGPNNFTISNVKVEEVNFLNAVNLLEGFRYDSIAYVSSAADEGYTTKLERHWRSAVFRIEESPYEERNTWNAKVNVRTGFTPETGKGYRVSVDIDARRPQEKFEIFYDGEEEEAYGALYEQTLSPGTNHFSYIIFPGDSKGELALQLRFGQTDGWGRNTYTIRHVRVEEASFITTHTPVIKNVCENDTQEGYTAELETAPEKATVRLVKTPAEGREAWKNKLFTYTGVKFEPGQKYRVSMVVKSIVPAPFEVCFNDLGVEKGIGGIFGLISKPVGQYVEFTTYADKQAYLVIQLSLGNCTTPNNIILSDVKVEKAGKVFLVSDTVYTF